MAKFENAVFGPGETVVIDDNEFINCRFEGCTIEYRGGPAALEDCSFIGIGFTFGGGSGAAVALLQNIAATGEYGAEIVRGVFGLDQADQIHLPS